MNTKWSEEAWAAAAPVYEAILAHPFIRQLADGTLPRDRFERYLRQDTIYIENYSCVLAHIASRLTEPGHVQSFIRFALDGTMVESAMHDTFLGGEHPDASEAAPSCMLYAKLLSAQATAPVEVEAAAVLPCFWVYQRVGAEIVRTAAADNPYRRWIDTYADAAFEESTRRAIAICDDLAAAASHAVRKAMTDIFVTCTRMEWLFWNSAWELETWKI